MREWELRVGESARAKLERIFFDAAERSGAAREEFLLRECGGDAGLLAEVRGLLAADARETIGPLRAEPLKALMDAAPAADESVPEQIGPYHIQRLIGEGGFGAVYLALQVEPVRREVAIKMLRPGMSTRDSLRRFERERRMLATLEHPGIARLLDAGSTAQGRPFFVMELVRGEPITAFCDRERLGTRGRLELFLDVCEAIGHAHQRGVIHRDIKPGNVLAWREEGGARLKVIDFGIAGVIAAPTRDKETRATLAGQFMGTPEYMSPEQAARSGVDQQPPVVDTRSDVYSLGVLLHELLTGEVPRDRQEVIAATLGSAAVAGEHGEPLRRPSARLTGHGERVERIASARGTDVRSLSREVRGDLDWIVLKALEREPERRYGSVGELAEDIRRSQADLPISAHAPSPGEVAWKFVRRHRVGVAAAAAVGLTLVAGLIGTGVGLVRAREAARKEHDASELAENRRVSAESAQELAEKRREDAEFEAYTGRIAAAAGALEASGPVDLRVWLDQCPERLRGWEWQYLHGLADQSEGAPTTAGKAVQCISTSPKAHPDLVAAACREDGYVLVLQQLPEGGVREVARLEMPMPEAARFSPDGTRLACASRAGTGGVRMYDTRTWKEIRGSWCTETAWDVAWSPDSTRLAVQAGVETRQRHGVVRIVDAATGAGLADTGMPVYMDIAWSADGRWVAAGDASGTLRVWDAHEERIALEQSLTKNKVTGVAFSATGELAACDDDGGVTLLRADAERRWGVEARLDQSRSPGFRCAFSPDGSRLAVATWGSTAWVWDVASRTVERELRGHRQLVHGVGFSATGERLWTGAYDGQVRSWDLRTPPQTTRASEQMGDPWLSVSADGRWCVTWTEPGVLGVFDVGTMRLSASVAAPRGTLMNFAFMPDSRRVVFADRDGSVILLDPWSGSREVRAHLPGQGMRPAAISASGRLVAGHCYGHGCVVVDLERGEVVWGLPRAMTEEAIDFEDEHTLLTRTKDGTLERWDLRTSVRTVVCEASKIGPVFAGSRSRDGRYLAVAAGDHRVSLLTPSGRVVASTTADQGPGMVFFTPDGSRLIGPGADGVVRFWEVPSLRLMAGIRAGRSPLCAAITPDGRSLQIKWMGGLMRVWRTEPGATVARP